MFPTDYKFDVVLGYVCEEQVVAGIQGQMAVSEKQYFISFKASHQMSNLLLKDVNSFVFHKFNKYFRIKSCSFNNQPLTTNFTKSVITHLRLHTHEDDDFIEWVLGVDKFSILKKIDGENTEAPIQFYLMNFGTDLVHELPFSDSSQAILDNKRDDRNLIYRGGKVKIGFDSDSNTPYLRFSTHKDSIHQEFLCLLSFYYQLPIKNWIVVKHKKDCLEYNYSSPFVAYKGDSKRQKEWDCYSTKDEKHLRLDDFVDSVNTFIEQSPVFQKDIVFKALYNFVDIQMDSDQSQFIFLVNILSTLSEKMHKYKGDTTRIIKKLFKLHNVSFPQIDDELQKQNFQRTEVKKQKCWFFKFCLRRKLMKSDQRINTFVDLRNELTHGLPTKEMLDYLHNSLILPRLKMGVFFILLSELGMKDLKYRYLTDALKVQKS